ncbi:hypothetical protein GE061_005533 [Apolygus lucorum]|uniref:Uncharacterized protein n=1 Tax=Apolygus lucorum TaxID=248454 RepID=A0A8S9WZ67_APOLU|nr:hypothetical protein GE061_005533 [Apolygus lucorum]
MSSQTLRNDLRLTPSPPPPPPPPRLSSTTATAVLPTVRKPTRPLPPGSSKKPEATAQSKESATKPLPLPPTTNHVHNRGDGSAEAAPTVTLVLNSALQRELRGLLHSWVAHASDIFNHNANTNPDFTSDAAAIHAHPHHGSEGRITEIDISKPPPPKSRPKSSVIIPRRPPLAQPPPPTQSGLPTPSPPLKIKN